MTTSNQNMNVQEEVLREKIDPCLTDANLSALVTEALGAKTRCDGYTVLTGGCWNRVIAVTVDGEKRRLVIKITPKTGDADLKREFEVLRYFRAHTAMPVPEPFLLDLTGERLPGSVLVMEKIPGMVLHDVYQRLSNEERKILSEEIADHIIALNAHQEIGFGGVEIPAEQRLATWMDFWLPRFDTTIVETQEKGGVSRELLDDLGEIRRYLPKLLDIGPRGTLTHYDIWTGNVMVAVRDDQLHVSGFLEPTGFFADYARELSSMFGLADQRLMQIYKQRHGFDESFEARFNAYSLKMCLQLICMYPGESRHVQNARRFLRQIQEYC